MRALRVAAVLLVALAACGGGAGRAQAGGEVRLQLASEPPHLLPMLAADFVITQIALGDVYEPLFRQEADGSLTPVLAEAVDVSRDGRVFSLRLREGVKWHDGRALSVDDVVFSLRLLAPGGVPSPLAADMADVEEVVARDARQVELRFKGFKLGREGTLALVPIVPKHVFGGVAPAELVGHPAARAPVGSGPLRFASWTPGEIVLERAATFRGPPAASARVVYRVIADRAQAARQVADGRVHVLFDVAPGPMRAELVKDERVRLLPYRFPSVLAARWQCRHGATADARVRRALTMLLDREAVSRTILPGRAQVNSAPWPLGDPALDPTVRPWPFDGKAARGLFEEAGQGDAAIELLVPAGSATLTRIATLWQGDARAAGVKLVIVPAPDVIERARRGDFAGGVLYAWSTAREADLFHHFHSSQVGQENYGGCVDGELDRLLSEVRVTADAKARQVLEQRLHRRLHELEPLTVIAVDGREAAIARGLEGFAMSEHGAPAARLRVAGK